MTKADIGISAVTTEDGQVLLIATPPVMGDATPEFLAEHEERTQQLVDEVLDAYENNQA
jgi:hypothetical protein